MADIHLARGEAGELVILKTLRPPVNDRRLRMFHDEAHLGLLFSHHNVVRTLAVGTEGTQHFIAMEFLDGQSVDRLVHRAETNAVPRETLLPVLLRVLDDGLAGLHHAHELANEEGPLHVVHRDFTPQNLFVTYDGQVKVLDFGIAKATGMSRTTTGEIKGKVRYMAPEQALGLRVDRRADIFAAGVLLWEIVAGAPFWKDSFSDHEVFDDLVGGAYRVEVPGAPEPLNAILRRALARDASERFRNAAEMQAALRAVTGPTSEALTVQTANLVRQLFAEQRARSEKMIERAIEGASAAQASGTSSASGASGAGGVVRAIAIPFAIAAALWSPSARAGEPRTAPAPSAASASSGSASSANADEAAEHFHRGVKLFDEGDFKLALVEFERSYELVAKYTVLYNIGEVQFQLNNYAQARRVLTRYLELGGELITANRRAQVEHDIDALKIRTARLRVETDVDGAEILVDGERLGRSPLTDAELVDAGSHRISAQKPGFVTATEAITLVGGDEKGVRIHLAPVPKTESRVVEVRESSGLGPVWIGWGLAVALGAATVGTGVAWQGADSRLTDLKKTESSQTDRDGEARSVDTLKTTTIILGSATLATAAVSLFFTMKRADSSHSSKTTATLWPDIDVGVGRFVATKRF